MLVHDQGGTGRNLDHGHAGAEVVAIVMAVVITSLHCLIAIVAVAIVIVITAVVCCCTSVALTISVTSSSSLPPC